MPDNRLNSKYRFFSLSKNIDTFVVQRNSSGRFFTLITYLLNMCTLLICFFKVIICSTVYPDIRLSGRKFGKWNRISGRITDIENIKIEMKKKECVPLKRKSPFLSSLFLVDLGPRKYVMYTYILYLAVLGEGRLERGELRLRLELLKQTHIQLDYIPTKDTAIRYSLTRANPRLFCTNMFL